MTTLSAQHEQAARLLAARPETLEPGLAVLDDHLELAAGVHVDLLACDSLGDPVAVLFCERDAAPVLARVAAITRALQAGRPLLRKLYGRDGLDADRPPRFALLAPRFADDTPALLEMVGPREVAAWEYRVVRTAEGDALLDLALFARSPLPRSFDDDAPGASAAGPAASARASAASPAPTRAAAGGATDGAAAAGASPASPSNGHHAEESADSEALRAVDAPDASKQLFQRARRSIRALSGEVHESGAPGRLDFRVETAPLATLRLGHDGLHLRVGDGDAEQSVADEDSFNAGLNAVFTHYFSRIARRA